MKIRNFEELARDKRKRNALTILEAGLDAACPRFGLERCLEKNRINVEGRSIDLTKYSATYIVAFGKAADSMTKTVNHILDIKSGFVVMPKDSKSIIKGKKFQIFYSSHPTPNQTSVDAAKAITKFLEKRKKSEFVIFLVSGGGSSLLCLPDGITLSDKMYVNNLLLRSGATIQEFNCIRKHLSKIKGGRLVENLPCDAVSLIMSDVLDDDLSSIASGTTYYDNTTFDDALSIIKKYNLAKKFPENAFERLIQGKKGEIPETPKKTKIINQIIATNIDCLNAMNKKAIEIGYTTKILHLSGDVKNATQKILKAISNHPKSCIIFGGETTVHVLGKGKGGRNQELVLRILKNIQKESEKIIVASMGTDGIDGNTFAAGAITKKFTIDADEIKSFLKNSDSNSFFQKYGGLIHTGYTHTNLMDIGLILT